MECCTVASLKLWCKQVDNIKVLTGNKVEKLKLFFVEGSLKALNIFGQFLMTAFESR